MHMSISPYFVDQIDVILRVVKLEMKETKAHQNIQNTSSNSFCRRNRAQHVVTGSVTYVWFTFKKKNK